MNRCDAIMSILNELYSELTDYWDAGTSMADLWEVVAAIAESRAEEEYEKLPKMIGCPHCNRWFNEHGAVCRESDLEDAERSRMMLDTMKPLEEVLFNGDTSLEPVTSWRGLKSVVKLDTSQGPSVDFILEDDVEDD